MLTSSNIDQKKYNSYTWKSILVSLIFLLNSQGNLSAQHGFKTLQLDTLIQEIEAARQNADFELVISKEKKLAFQYQVRKDYVAALATFGRIEDLAKQLDRDTLYYTALNKKAKCYYRLKDNLKCDSIYSIIINSSNVPAIPKGSAYQYSANLLKQDGQYEKAKKYYNLAFENYETENDSFRIPIVLRHIGSVCRSQADPVNALKAFQKATTYYRPNSPGYDMIINVYNSINNLFYEHNNYSQALEYSTRIIDLSQNLKSKPNRYFYLSLHAKNLAALDFHEEADSLFKEILEFCNTEDPFNRITLMQSYLRYSLSIYDIERAEIILDSLDIDLYDMKQSRRIHSLLGAQLNFAEDKCKYYFLTKQFSKLKEELQEVEEFMNDKEDISLRLIFHRYTYEYEKANGNYEQALKNHEQALTIEDSLFKLDQLLLVQDSEMRYKKAEQENKINLLSTENDLAAFQLQTSSRRNRIFGSALLIISMLSLFLTWLYRKIKRKNKIIQEANDEKSILLQEIHHRVKNNLQVISSLLALQGKYVKDDHALDALKQGQDRVQSMALIHQDLYQSDNLKGVNAQDYFEQVVDNLFDSYNIAEDKIELELEVTPIMLDVDTMIPLGLVINELVSNSLKHAFENSENGIIKVKLKEVHSELILEVRDNGVGVESIDEIDGQSFGYELIKAFAKKLKAEIIIDNTNGFAMQLFIKNYKLAA